MQESTPRPKLDFRLAKCIGLGNTAQRQEATPAFHVPFADHGQDRTLNPNPLNPKPFPACHPPAKAALKKRFRAFGFRPVAEQTSCFASDAVVGLQNHHGLRQNVTHPTVKTPEHVNPCRASTTHSAHSKPSPPPWYRSPKPTPLRQQFVDSKTPRRTIIYRNLQLHPNPQANFLQAPITSTLVGVYYSARTGRY